MMSSTFIIGGNTKAIQLSGREAAEIYKPIPMYLRAIRSLYFTLGIDSTIWMVDMKKILPGHKLIILFDYPTMRENCAVVEKYADKDARLVLYFWNPLFIYSNDVLNTVSSRWERWTFDPVDAKKHSMKYGGQFLYDSLFPQNIYGKDASDIFFIGQDKGRFAFLKPFEKELNSFGIKTEFYYVDALKSLWSNFYSKPIHYKKMLELVRHSKSILEINQGNQNGLTLRALEALFLGKKLVTNNATILNYKFAKEMDIYLLENDHSSIKNFLDRPVKTLQEEYLTPYRFCSWLERIENNIELDDYIE